MAARVHAFLSQLPLAYLRQHGGVPAEFEATAFDSPDGVPIAVQRRLLQWVAQRGGDAALLALGHRLSAVADQPLLFVMLNARSVSDFIDKEQRFNRFFHASHRVRVLEQGARHIVLQHHGDSAQDLPVRVESLFVLGLHLYLFEQIGCGRLSVRFPSSRDPAAMVVGPPFHAVPAGGVAVWHIAWERFAQRREPLAGLDELLLAQAEPRDLASDESPVGRLQRLLSTDLAHRWTVAEAAAGLHMASRSLQRALGAAGTTFSRELEGARVRTAQRLLADPARSVTEVGYLCGFADGAHFSRRFKALTGCAPVAWRRQQGAPQA